MTNGDNTFGKLIAQRFFSYVKPIEINYFDRVKFECFISPSIDLVANLSSLHHFQITATGTVGHSTPFPPFLSSSLRIDFPFFGFCIFLIPNFVFQPIML